VFQERCGCGRAINPHPTSQQAADNYSTLVWLRAAAAMVGFNGDRKMMQLNLEGSHHIDSLHGVLHDPGHPRVNYFSIARWMRRVQKRIKMLGIADAQVDAFIETL
jgi:hypothetical protein